MSKCVTLTLLKLPKKYIEYITGVTSSTSVYLVQINRCSLNESSVTIDCGDLTCVKALRTCQVNS